MKDYTIRNATTADIPFLAEAIIEAEKSGTAVLTYSTLFGLTEDETRKYISQMLLEETDGCELSVSSFLVAEKDNQLMAAVAAWMEAAEGVTSNVLKRNLLNYVLPKSSFQRASGVSSIVQDLYIKEDPGTIQIGMVYVAPAFRGLNLTRILIDEQIKFLLAANPGIREICVQVFGNNQPAISVYRKAGFEFNLEKVSDNPDVFKYFPSDRKILMKKTIIDK